MPRGDGSMVTLTFCYLEPNPVSVEPAQRFTERRVVSRIPPLPRYKNQQLTAIARAVSQTAQPIWWTRSKVAPLDLLTGRPPPEVPIDRSEGFRLSRPLPRTIEAKTIQTARMTSPGH
jgi:hypothetical protein